MKIIHSGFRKVLKWLKDRGHSGLHWGPEWGQVWRWLGLVGKMGAVVKGRGILRMGKAHSGFPHSTQKSGRSSDRVAPECQGGRWRKGVLGWDWCQRSSVLYLVWEDGAPPSNGQRGQLTADSHGPKTSGLSPIPELCKPPQISPVQHG